jgi:hypothetical protein
MGTVHLRYVPLPFPRRDNLLFFCELKRMTFPLVMTDAARTAMLTVRRYLTCSEAFSLLLLTNEACQRARCFFRCRL